MGAERFLVAAVTLLAATVFAEDVAPVANIEAGQLVGKTIESPSLPRIVYAFLGVPYAQPPVGDLRFALPQPVTPWEGVRDATKYAAGCPQYEIPVRQSLAPLPLRETPLDEDCLYLDVYTPDVNGKRDVLFLMHGGGFTVGKGSMYDGSALVAFGDIVVVSINYRIGLLGFLHNNEGYWPKNLGFRDQQFALRWARDNIAAFGGDPERITLAGESAGSISTSLHIVSPESRGLFHRAICQSGSLFTTSWTTKVDYSAITMQLLGCSGLDADATLTCLREKSVEDFLATNIPGALIADDDVYPEDPIDVYLKEKFPNVDLLIGNTGDEGSLLAEYVIPAISAEEIDAELYAQHMVAYLHSQYGNNVDTIYEEVMKFYFGGDLAGHTTHYIRQQTAEIVGTQVMIAPTYYNAQLHAGRCANTYYYRFVYQPSFLSGLRPSWHTGLCDHSFELTFTLGMPLMLDLLPGSLNVTAEDITLAEKAVKYWTNFVKTGNPNGEDLVQWEPFTSENEDYLVLHPECQQASAYKPDAMSFWNEQIRALDVKYHPKNAKSKGKSNKKNSKRFKCKKT